MKEEKIGMTIYFPPEIKKKIEERTAVFGRRSQTEEVMYLIRQGLEYEELRSDWILSRLKSLSQAHIEEPEH